MKKQEYLDYLKLYDKEFSEKDLEGNQFYFGDDLGITYTPDKTLFKVWSPDAEGIEVLVFEEETSTEAKYKENMSRVENGIWSLEISGDLLGMYHIYQVEINGEVRKIVDPYTRGLGTNSNLGLIVDLRQTNPEGWSEDKRIKLEQAQNAVIYEVHVRDFSSSENSGITHKNQYLAFTENNTTNNQGKKTGIDHLKEMGITHVHLQPVFDFATVDDLSDEGYNWGYDPYFYNVPEGSYASNPSDDSRIREFKQMVKSLHDNGIGVIMDVVYNHTYYTEASPFNKLAPKYYYRMDDYGNFSNGSGTGNEIASEKPMVRKFIVDSVNYWAEEYHIDGFRFDLMALHDRVTMTIIDKSLHNLDDSILIYGEPWKGGWSPLPDVQQMTKGAQQGMKIAVFNDNFRNAIKGDNDGQSRGFVSGDNHQKENVKRGIVAGTNYNEKISDFASEPWETINYVSSHDNLTLWDKLHRSNTNDSEDVRIKMDRLAQGIIFTSQGIPFIHGGEEFLRTKYGNHNSYNAGDKVNQLKWNRKSKYFNTFCYYKGIISLRKNHPAFRLADSSQIRECLKYLETPYNTIGFCLGEYANNDSWKDILVYYNPNRESISVELPSNEEWKVVTDDQKAGNEILYTIKSQKLQLPPISMFVLFNKSK